MSGHQQQEQDCSAGISTRKKRRGMIEKRRRDKINSSLGELRKLVPAAFEKQGSAKLEKAEILQMTVDYLRLLHARGLADILNSSRVPSTFALHPVQQQEQASDRVPISGSQHQLCVSPARLSHQSNQSGSLIDSQYNGDNSSAAGSQSDHNTFETSAGICQSSNNNQQAAAGLLGQGQADQLTRPMSELMNSASPSLGAQSQNGHSPNSLSHSQAAVMAASHQHHLYSQHHQIAYHHHLSNPMATSTDVTNMIPYSQSYHQHHGAQQPADAVPLKLDPSHHRHQTSLVGINNHSHPSLLNLDHHHPLTSHYSGHHYQPSALL